MVRKLRSPLALADEAHRAMDWSAVPTEHVRAILARLLRSGILPPRSAGVIVEHA